MSLGIKKIRKTLGKEAIKHSDEELLGVELIFREIADMAIDNYLKMTPEQRKAIKEKTSSVEINKNKHSSKTIVEDKPQPTIDFAAEQLARLFIEQAKWKLANKKKT